MKDFILPGIGYYQDKRLTCFEQPIYAYLKWCGYDPVYLGLAAWSFTDNYVKHYAGAAENAPLRWIIDCAEAVYGIETEILLLDETDAIPFIADMLKNGQPVMIYIDSYYCPWFPSYHRSHVHHYVLIVGMGENQEFICIDKPYDASEFKRLPMEDFKQGRGIPEIFIMRHLGKKAGKHQDAEIFLKNHMNALTESDIPGHIRAFAATLNAGFDVRDEICGYHDSRVAPIYTWLKGIYTGREKFADSLEVVDCAAYAELIPQMRELARQWMSVLVKLMLQTDREINPQHMTDCVIEISQKEALCVGILQNIIERSHTNHGRVVFDAPNSVF